MPMAEFSGGAAWTVTVVCNVAPPLHLMVIAYLVGEVGKTPTSLDFEPVTIATTDAGSAGVLVTVGVPDVHAVRPTAVATPAGTLWVASVTSVTGSAWAVPARPARPSATVAVAPTISVRTCHVRLARDDSVRLTVCMLVP